MSLQSQIPMSVSAVAVASTEGGPAQHRWEESGEATWDTAVQEDEEGNIISTASESSAQAIRRRRKRLEQTDYSQKLKRVVRDMIRYMYIVVDASRWMRTKDPVIPPGSRLEVTLNLLQEFVHEYFDQNPLSHLGFVILRDGEAEILSQLSSNSKAHKVALQSFGVLAASEHPSKGGEFSLQNGLEVAGRSLGHQPRHGSREIVVLFGALSTCDPGNILTETLPRLQAANVRVSSFALSAELHVCRKLAEESSGVMGVCLDKGHFRDWLLGGQCTPPPAIPNSFGSGGANGCEMVRMGFPTRASGDVPTLVHATRDTKILARTAFVCPQCQAKQSELPTDCVVCGLKLVLAPHLARSFHHLFPVPPFAEVPIETELARTQSMKHLASGNIQVFTMTDSLVAESEDFDRCCFACLKMIGTIIIADVSSNKGKKVKPTFADTAGDEVLRFQCPECKNLFCPDCDAYLHETLHNCPGCLSKSS
jgi:transcription initiation factor TFIIH subunit 2